MAELGPLVKMVLVRAGRPYPDMGQRPQCAKLTPGNARSWQGQAAWTTGAAWQHWGGTASHEI